MKPTTCIVLVLCCLLGFSLAAKQCKNDKECLSTHFCAESSVCTLKYAKFCNSDSDCERIKEACIAQDKRERGVCAPNPYLSFSAKLEAVMEGNETLYRVEPMPIEMVAKLPKLYHNIKEHEGDCGTEHHHEVKANAWSDCAQGICDNPTERDKFTTSPAKVIKLTWNVIDDGDFSLVAKERISASTTELNLIYGSTGFTFESTIRVIVSSKYKAMSISKTCPSGSSTWCIDPYTMVKEIVGLDWQKKGAFQILVRPLEPTTLNGFAHFPWMQDHGLVVMNTRVVAAGYTTLPHELGHAFGLWHTFHGTEEVTCSSVCYESVASNENGDFCADTQPTPLSRICGDATNNDRCSTKTTWPNSPYKNIMGYTSCRSVFTPQQVRRTRCWFTKFVNRFYK